MAITSKKRILQFLQGQELMTIATTSSDGIPMGATVNYYVNNKFQFYFLTKYTSRKCKNLEHNQNVGLVITNNETLATAQIQGVASPVTAKKEFKEAVDNIIERMKDSPYYWEPATSIIRNHEARIFRVDVDWIRWFDLALLDGKDYEEIAEVLTF